jgi:hypothetical protein
VKIFDSHLESLRNAREQTDEAILLLGESHHLASKALAITWQILFDSLSKIKPDKQKLTDANTAAGVIYKLAQSAQMLKSVEHKSIEFEEKLAERRAARAHLAQTPGLPPEVRDELERALNLIG